MKDLQPNCTGIPNFPPSRGALNARAIMSDLDLLPDVAIAEEARDNTVNGQAIYELIVQQPTRYAVMDDYNRLVRDTPIPGASLNGDTCVRSMLDKPQPAGDLVNADTVAKLYFDITEDRNISVTGILPTERPVSPETVRLLFTPLPRDLPAVDKDILILISAWSGDIDRYARLRRPVPVPGELQCVVRGIYHNTFFAKWWSTLPHVQHERLLGSEGRNLEHIHARLVMNNDLSWLTDSTPESELPRLIRHPHFANRVTYEELVRRRPSMKKTCVIACMHYNDKEAFTRFGEVIPDDDLLDAASDHDHHGWHCKWIETRAKELDIDLFPYMTDRQREEWQERRWKELWPMAMVHCKLWRSVYRTSMLYREITTGHLGFHNETPAMPGWKAAMNDCGRYAGIDMIELHVSALENVSRLVPEGYELRDLVVAYRDWEWVEERHIKMLGLYPDPAQPGGGAYRGRGRGRGGRVLPPFRRTSRSTMPSPGSSP
ncbi:uncharacterized protein B0T15DRAFT_543975 [Chaetomium strumarium]|uniref:Uncharacterized protein n=1 Tax=Chaetomium strumarium TaxID=1170767 RepID=A0AAJ0GMP7_9PEZI|nr:hypothetical protein B0T15DRAFT_543975 [Chaetomium strumarium]